MATVAIIMGSDSDLEVMKDAARALDEFNVTHNLTVVSAHRTPQRLFDFAKKAGDDGLKVIIAGAGGAAHLPGMVASITHLPVIGVPVHTKSMNGIDSLYSIVQMPPGVPVATMAINGAYNAGLLAVQILAASDASLAERLIKYKMDLQNLVEQKATKLEKLGWKNYLSQ